MYYRVVFVKAFLIQSMGAPLIRRVLRDIGYHTDRVSFKYVTRRRFGKQVTAEIKHERARA